MRLSHSQTSSQARPQGIVPPGVLPRLVSRTLLGAVGSVLLGCSGDTTGVPAASATPTFWTLALNQFALNMSQTAPSNTFQLIATPLSVTGTTLPQAVVSAAKTFYRGTDSSVTVDSTGLVTAHFPTPLTAVLVSMTAQGIVITDTVWVQVTSTPPASALATLSLQSASNDSAKRSFGTSGAIFFPWPVTATDAMGQTICSPGGGCPLVVHYSSSDSAVAVIDADGNVQGRDTGHVTFRATTWAYGVARQDSVAFTMGYTIDQEIKIQLDTVRGVEHVGFVAPPTLVLGVGAFITFWDRSVDPVDVVFQGPAAPDTAGCQDILSLLTGVTSFLPPTGSGTIALFGGDTTSLLGRSSLQFFSNANFRCRRFPTPGRYHYYSTVFPSDTFTLDVRRQE